MGICPGVYVRWVFVRWVFVLIPDIQYQSDQSFPQNSDGDSISSCRLLMSKFSLVKILHSVKTVLAK